MSNKQQAIRYTVLLFNELNNIVMEWDPYGLSNAREISNEFSDEVWALLQKLADVKTEQDALQIVVEVFSQSFSEQEFNKQTCQEISKRVFLWWSEKT